MRLNKVHENEGSKMKGFFSLNRVGNLVVHPIHSLGYVITISVKC